MRDLPTSNQILEELADRTVGHIDRLQPVAFDIALREMTRYHRFLLALNATQAPEGEPFNFAEIAGDSWRRPHQEWLRQYRRLFERAADRMPDDSHFIRSLAWLPQKLLPGPDDPELPPGIVTAFIDLGPMLMHRLENWVTKRTTIETPEGQAAEPRLILAGSDAKAYSDTLREFIGAWENLLQRAPSKYRWKEAAAESDDARWSAFSASWPFLWKHLTNTSYCLAVAVWNEDVTGGSLFRETLVRWSLTFKHQLKGHQDLRLGRYLLPDTLSLDWQEVQQKIKPLAHEFMPELSPDEVFAIVLRGAHNDVLVLTAALLLHWTMRQKQFSDIGARTAFALLRREAGKDAGSNAFGADLSFRSLFLDLLRFEFSGEHFVDGSYAAEIDTLIEQLDNMTERSVVPGRVYTPSTLNGWDELLFSIVTILASTTPDDGDNGLGQRVTKMVSDVEVLPGGDRSIRNIKHKLSRIRETLETHIAEVTRGISYLKSDLNNDRAIDRLHEIIGSLEAAIDKERNAQLQSQPIDQKKVERIRAAVEEGLLNGSFQAPFFHHVSVERVQREDAVDLRESAFVVSKDELVTPPMTSSEVPLEFIVMRTEEKAGNYAWNEFTRRPRERIEINKRVDDEAFWLNIASLVEKIGLDPILVVSRNAEGRILRRLLYSKDKEKPDLRVQHHPREDSSGSYLATVEGVDVFGADFPAGIAWLFSRRALTRASYSELEMPGRYVNVFDEVNQDLKVTLRLQFRQILEWSDAPIYELAIQDPDELQGE